MVHMKSHQRGQRVAAFPQPTEAPVRPTAASKLLILQALIDQYAEARKAVEAATSESATAKAGVAATRAYRTVATHFIDQCGMDKSTYAHMQPAPKDLKTLCARMGIEYGSFTTSKRDGALVKPAIQEEYIGKIKIWLSEHPNTPKPSGQQLKR